MYVHAFDMGTFQSVVILALVFAACTTNALVFKLDNTKQCFYEKVVDGGNAKLNFKVVSSDNGMPTIDCTLKDENGLSLFSNVRKQDGSYTWNTANQKNVTFELCFLNDFTKTTKTISFDFSVGDERPSEKIANMKSACDEIAYDFTASLSHQADCMLNEVQEDIYVESLGFKVQIVTIIQLFMMCCMMARQVIAVRSLFSERRHSIARTVT